MGTLWIATEIYYPEVTSTGYILTRLAEGLAASGDVAVLCAQPSYDRSGTRLPSAETVNEVTIARVVHPGMNRNRVLGRAINSLVVSMRMAWRAFRSLRRGDTLLAVTNPPMLPFAMYAAARLRRVPIALLVHDLYPEAAILAGIIAPGSMVARIWTFATTWLFRRADRIVVLGRDAAELIASRMPDGEARIRVISNWADADEVRPEPAEDNPLLHAEGLAGRFVLGYAGNMGRVQDVELLLAAARKLSAAAPDVHLVFVGSGYKAPLVAAAASEPDSNVTLLGPRERSEQHLFLNACHVGIVALTAGMSGVGVPSRLYNLLAAGRPVIAAVDHDSEPARVLREEGVGVQTTPGDVEEFVKAVLDLRADPHFRREAAERARRAAVERFGFGATLAAYHELLSPLGWTRNAA